MLRNTIESLLPVDTSDYENVFELWDRVFPPGAPRWDSTYGNENARRFVQEVGKQNFDLVEQALKKVKNDNDLTFYVEVIAQNFARRIRDLDRWVDGSGGAGMSRLVRGTALVHAAWLSRGSDRAHNVTRRGWKGFARMLQDADEDLSAATDQLAKSAAPIAARLPCWVGMNCSIDTAKRLYLEGCERVPDHYALHKGMLMRLCEKWGGSHQEMHNFALATCERLPEGSPARQVQLSAHAEYWLYLTQFENRDRDGEMYFKREQVRRQVLAVSSELTTWASVQSLVSLPVLANYGAWSLWKARFFNEALEMFELTDGYVSKLPWGFEYKPRVLWRQAKKECEKRAR